MAGLMKRLSKFTLKVFITDTFLVGFSAAISFFFKMKISDVLVYVGILCIIIGGFSMMGSSNNSADTNYYMSKSIGTKAMNEITEENYKSRNKSMRFLMFMSCSGGLLIAIVVLTDFLFK